MRGGDRSNGQLWMWGAARILCNITWLIASLKHAQINSTSLLRNFVNTYSSSIVRVGLPHVHLGVRFQLIMLCFSVYPLQAVSHKYWMPLFRLIDDFYRDMPPAGGFEALRYKRNLPLRGPSGLAILGGVTALCAYGFYRVGMGNIEKR